MKSGKEKIYQLIKWFRRNRLIQKIRSIDVSKQYLIIFFIIVFYFIIWNLYNIKHFEIDDNSARYLLSALLQSQAAIIAIVITMTLVAVQFTASAYSPRVIDIFKHDVVMWRLLLLYGFSIFYGVFLLETIGGKYSIINPWSITFSLEFCIFIAFFIGIVSFGGLFWHVGKATAENKLEKAVSQAEISLGDVGKAATENKLESAEYQAVKSLGVVGRIATENILKEAASEAIESLGDFGKIAAENKIEGVARSAISSLRDIGKAAKEKKLEKIVFKTAWSIVDI